MKVLIFITVWKRPEVTDLTYSGLDRVQSILKEEGIDSKVFVVSSEDYHTKKAQQRGYEVVEVENFPVGAKMNTGMKHALELDWDWDCMLRMDSNNLLSSLYVRMWVAAYKSGLDIFGSSQFVALMPNKVHARIFNMSIGFGPVGMGVARKVLEAQKEWFDLTISKRVDESFWRKVVKPWKQRNKHGVVRIANKNFASVLDIKTGEDINKHHGATDIKREYYTRWYPEIKNWFD